jgi:hypothetical protein
MSLDIDECQILGDIREVEGFISTSQGIFSAYGYCGPNGDCVDQVNSYTCSCRPGYTGKQCDTGAYSLEFLSYQH